VPQKAANAPLFISLFRVECSPPPTMHEFLLSKGEVKMEQSELLKKIIDIVQKELHKEASCSDDGVEKDLEAYDSIVDLLESENMIPEAKARYVFFDDSESDPAYAGVHSAYLVVSTAQPGMSTNPCAPDFRKIVSRIIPETHDELVPYAEILGWDLSIDVKGEIVLHTKIAAINSPTKREITMSNSNSAVANSKNAGPVATVATDAGAGTRPAGERWRNRF